MVSIGWINEQRACRGLPPGSLDLIQVGKCIHPQQNNMHVQIDVACSTLMPTQHMMLPLPLGGIYVQRHIVETHALAVVTRTSLLQEVATSGCRLPLCFFESSHTRMLPAQKLSYR